MGTNANKHHGGELSPNTTSFSGKHPDFANDVPDSFRNAPLQRRGESERGGGSEMVKRDKPHPELRPDHEQGPIRETFNQAWLREQREARLNELERQRAQRRKSPEHSIHRDWEEQRQRQHEPER